MNLFKIARKFMARRLAKDVGLMLSYKANIAMCIYDNRRKDGRLNLDDCNEVAEKLIGLIFDAEQKSFIRLAKKGK